MTHYAVFHLDLDNVQQEQLGEVELDSSRMLHVLSAAPSAGTRLDEAAKDLNERPELIIKLPPDDDDKNSRDLQKEAVGRADPRFFDAIQDNLKRWHNMVLGAQ